MAITISQGIVAPAGLADGQTARASHVTPLYSALNAFLIPDTVGVFQQALIDDSLTTLTIGGTVTKDYSFSVVQAKSIMVILPFSWSGATGIINLAYRLNGSAVTAAKALTNAASGNGLIWGFIGAGHDADVPRPLMLLQLDDGNTFGSVPANANLPAADISSFGVTISVATVGSVKLKYFRAWREG